MSEVSQAEIVTTDKNGMKVSPNLVGFVFGRLTVRERSTVADDGQQLWKCACECGGTSYPRTSGLLNGNSTSCGCLTRERTREAQRNRWKGIDLTGQIFDHLTVVNPIDERTVNGCRQWACLCSCGSERIASTTVLRRRRVISCGCVKGSPSIEGSVGKSLIGDGHTRARSLSRNVTPAPYRKLFEIYKSAAIRRGIRFDLSIDEAVLLFTGDCTYCGAPPTRPKGSKVYNGIDRVDNTAGYSIGNSVSCCRTCNVAKGVMSAPDFLAWVGRVAKHNNLI